MGKLLLGFTLPTISDDQLRSIGGLLQTIERAAREIDHADNAELDGSVNQITQSSRVISQILRDIQSEAPEIRKDIGSRTPSKGIDGTSRPLLTVAKRAGEVAGLGTC